LKKDICIFDKSTSGCLIRNKKRKKFFIPILVFAESSTFILPYVFLLLFRISSGLSFAKKDKK